MLVIRYIINELYTIIGNNQVPNKPLHYQRSNTQKRLLVTALIYWEAGTLNVDVEIITAVSLLWSIENYDHLHPRVPHNNRSPLRTRLFSQKRKSLLHIHDWNTQKITKQEERTQVWVVAPLWSLELDNFNGYGTQRNRETLIPVCLIGSTRSHDH